MKELLMSGVELMLVGMGIVYLFLAMLVVAVNIMSALIERYLPTPLVAAGTSPNAAKTSLFIEPGVVAAITAAIHQYRSKHKQDL